MLQRVAHGSATVAAAALTVAAASSRNIVLTLGAAVVLVLTILAWWSSTQPATRSRTLLESEGWAALDRELRRQRRHGRHMTLGMLRPVDGHQPSDVATELLRAVRHDDVVFTSGGTVLVGLPEAHRDVAEAPLARLSKVLAEARLGANVCAATYPDDGLTIPALVDAATQAQAVPLGVTQTSAVEMVPKA